MNLDLIYGAAGETLESWSGRFRRRFALAPSHISAYGLTIEPATALGRQVARGDVPAPDPVSRADMFETELRPARRCGVRPLRGLELGATPDTSAATNLGYWGAPAVRRARRGAHVPRRPAVVEPCALPREYLSMVERGELPSRVRGALEPARRLPRGGVPRIRILQGIPASWVDEARADPYTETGLLFRDDGHLVPIRRGHALLNELVLGLTG